MPARLSEKLLRLACLGALGALALMTWQLFEPTVFPVIVAMSLGQLLGTASFVLYLVVVAADVRRRLGTARTSEPPASDRPAEPNR